MLPGAVQVPARYALKRWRHDSEPELRWLLDALPRGGTVLDVGANKGHYTFPFSLRHRVEAFEPLPQLARVLQGFAAVHPRVRVHNAALGSEAAVLPLYVPYRNGALDTGWASFLVDSLGGLRHEVVEVPVRTLDSFEFADVVGIKIDVEGWERSVMEGGLQTIKRCHPVILMEMDRRFHKEPLDEGFRWMSHLGYSGAWLDEHHAERPISEYDVGRYQQWEMKKRPLGRLVNTFLWRPNNASFT